MLKQADGILNKKHLKEVVNVTIQPNGIVYRVNEEKKEEITNKYYGKKLIVTDHAGWTTREILTAYNEQDCIEKLFRDTKDTEHFSLRPIYHWTDQKIRVHIFICLLGLTLTILLQKELEMQGIKYSKDKLLNLLSGIRECLVMTDSGIADKNSIERKMEEMDNEQLKIWSAIAKF
jgi:transposase